MSDHDSVGDALARVKQLSVRNFRGWGEPEAGTDRSFDLDVDAEIVLLSGANGLGKSSLLEALAQLLCEERVNQGPSGIKPTWGELVHRPPEGGSEAITARRAHLKMTGTTASGHAVDATCSFGGGATTDTAPDFRGSWHELLLPRMSRDGHVPSDMLLSTCAFFQDQLRRLLDDAARSVTLLEWFFPTLPVVADLIVALDRRASLLKMEADSLQERLDAVPTRKDAYARGARDFAVAWTEMRRQLPEVVLPDLASSFDGQPAELLNLVESVGVRGQRIPHEHDLSTMLQMIGEALGRTVTAADDEKVKKIRNSLSALEREQQEDRRRYEVLRPLLAGLRTETAGQANILTVYRSLAANTHRWAIDLAALAEVYPALAPVAHELTLLDVGAQRARNAALQTLFQDADTLGDTIVRRQAVIDDLLRQLDERRTLVIVGAVRGTLDDWKEAAFREGRRLRDASRSDALREGVQRLFRLAGACEHVGQILRLAPTAADDEGARPILAALHQALDATLFRFHFDEHFLPVRARREERENHGVFNVLTAANGRRWTDASTGQQAQIGLGYLLAQALVLRDRLPHRILILDDTSSAFDLGNLSRQATWIRQLAYGPDPKARFQIFIASHHDEMTARLVEALLPPPGSRLVAIQCNNWTAGVGPHYDVLGQNRRGEKDPDAAGRLSRALHNAWEPPLKEPQ